MPNSYDSDLPFFPMEFSNQGNSVIPNKVSNREGVSECWEDLSDWRTVRRDIRILRRAVKRAEMYAKDRPHE